MKKTVFILLCLLSTAQLAFAETWREARTLPVLHNGRIKPFEAYARQTLRLVADAGRWEKKPAAQMLWEYLAGDRSKLKELAWIRLDHRPLKQTLGVDEKKKFFSYDELSAVSDRIERLVRQAKDERDRDERPSMTAQKAEQLYSRLRAVEGAVSGEAWQRVPIDHVSRSRIALEVLYHRAHPFQAAAALYFLSFALLSISNGRPGLASGGQILATLAFFLHSFGLAARVFILSRPPVSNMYESMIFMNWAVMLFAFVFAGLKRNLVPLAAGAMISALVMLYADLLPIDSSLDVVVAVLRSNYWLTVHVLTVVSSYGAFGLAMALGHRFLFLRAAGKLGKKQQEGSAQLIFRVIQLGTLLIGTGTFLGGVWANESWGRFWGWDPKETWALITFLGYLFVVHLKYAKRISDLWMAVSSVLGFQLVLMTWYGVNFVLGRGLHSYGAGSGGMEWVTYYLVAEALFLAWVFSTSGKKRSSG